MEAPDGNLSTERGTAEEALRESELRFRQMAENLREVILLIDHKNYKVLYVNPAYEKVWGRTCQSLYNNPASWLDAIHPEDLKRVCDALENQHATGEFCQEFRIVQPNGELRWISDQAYPIRDEHGEIYRLVGISEDITRRKQAEKQLKELVTHLARVEHNERRKLAKVLHDNVGQQLSAAILLLTTLHETKVDSQANIEEIKRILDSTLQFTRDLVDRLVPPLLYDIGLSEALDVLAQQFGRWGLVVEVQEEGESQELSADTATIIFESIRELLFNVLRHASMATAALRVIHSKTKMTVLVIDKGIGFNIDDLYDTEPSNHFGLLNVQTRMEAVGGAFEVQSTRGEGTRITLSCPTSAALTHIG